MASRKKERRRHCADPPSLYDPHDPPPLPDATTISDGLIVPPTPGLKEFFRKAARWAARKTHP